MTDQTTKRIAPEVQRAKFQSYNELRQRAEKAEAERLREGLHCAASDYLHLYYSTGDVDTYPRMTMADLESRWAERTEDSAGFSIDGGPGGSWRKPRGLRG